MAPSRTKGTSELRQMLTLLGIFLTLFITVYSQEITWINDFDEGIKLARDGNRPVLIDFWSQWCIPCGREQKEVYSDPRLIEICRKFVCIRVNTDQDPAAPRRFGITSLPAKRLLDPWRTVLLKIDKSETADDLLQAMKSVPLDFDSVVMNFAEIEGDPFNVEALRSIGDFYMKAGLTSTAGEFFARADKPRPAPVNPQVLDDPRSAQLAPFLPAPIPAILVPDWRPVVKRTTSGDFLVPACPIVDSSYQELMEKYSEVLKGIKFDTDQRLLEPLLKKVGDSVTEFMANLPNTTATELIRQWRLNSRGKVEAKLEQEVRYLLFSKTGPDDRRGWREERTDRKGTTAKLKRLKGQSFLSYGYATACAIFLPEYQKGMRYRYLGQEATDPSAYVFAFAQPGLQNLISAGVRVDGRDVLYSIQGIVWVDPKTYQIVKMMTDFPDPIPETGLTRLVSEINYGEVRFGTSSKSFWLPREVVITSKYGGDTYRNIHRYSDYKLFTVESFEERKTPGHQATKQ